MTMTLQELSDREELRLLIHTLAVDGDVQDMDSYCGCYTEDGILELPIFKVQTREGIRAKLTGDPSGRAALRIVRHNITSSKITLTGPDSARGRSYFLVYYGPGADHMGHYEDSFQRVDGRWLVNHRKVHLDWVSETSKAARTEAARAKLLSWPPPPEAG